MCHFCLKKLTISAMSGRHISFDQTNEKIALSTNHGFIVYECASGVVLYEAHFPGGGATCLSILSDSNLVACSGDNSPDGFQRNDLVLWNCKKDSVMKLWTLESPIESIIFRADCLIVVHGSHITFYDCRDFELTYTTTNPTPGKFCVALGSSSQYNLVAMPNDKGDGLNIADYHDPGYILGFIPIPFKRINFFAFDPKGELLAIVVDEAKYIQLWSVVELRMIAKFKRGIRSAEVSGIAFDHLSNFFIMTTTRGTMHVFAIPTPAERTQANMDKSIRSKFSYELPKGTDFHCQFDIAGYVITGITDDGIFKQVRLDVEKGTVVPVCDRVLEL